LTHDGLVLGSTNPESKFSQPQIGSDNGEPMVCTRDETLRYKKILGNYKLDLKGIKELTNILMLKDRQVLQLKKRVKSLTVSQCEYIGQIKEYDLLLGQFKNDLLGKDNLLLQKQTENKEIVKTISHRDGILKELNDKLGHASYTIHELKAHNDKINEENSDVLNRIHKIRGENHKLRASCSKSQERFKNIEKLSSIPSEKNSEVGRKANGPSRRATDQAEDTSMNHTTAYSEFDEKVKNLCDYSREIALDISKNNLYATSDSPESKNDLRDSANRNSHSQDPNPSKGHHSRVHSNKPVNDSKLIPSVSQLLFLIIKIGFIEITR
jgi:FtsZ-binding cell division protein ZapB